MNRFVGVGRITKNVELRHTANDIAVTSFTIAINRTYRNADGESEADFINCVAWRVQAENLVKYCGKGDLVGVEGKIQTRSYDDAEGTKRYITEIQCDNVQYLETNRERKQVEQSIEKVKTDNAPIDVTDDDLPF